MAGFAELIGGVPLVIAHLLGLVLLLLFGWWGYGKRGIAMALVALVATSLIGIIVAQILFAASCLNSGSTTIPSSSPSRPAECHMIAEPMVPPGWEVLGVFVEGAPVDLRGVDPWGSEHRPTDRTIPVAHPSYPNQRYRAHMREAVGPDSEPLTFALVEVSAGVCAFFLQASDARS